MIDILADVFRESARVVVLVFVMMVAVDLFNLWSKGKLGGILAQGGRWRQYLLVPLIAAVPGCLGAFTAVSLYMHRIITFGALAGAMIASSGDEAFVMLAMFPDAAVRLFIVLVILGMVSGRIIDRFLDRLHIDPGADCDCPSFHPLEGGMKHYLQEHVWRHIVRRHIGRTAIWTVAALLIVRFGIEYARLDRITTEFPLLTLVLSGVIGLIPESGPHLIIVTLFASGAIPFSVLLTSSIVQDGHGMLPMLAHSLRNTILLKSINLVIGITIGLILLIFGI